ncbi:unnamed protein product [Closterium sp. NIES-54]
MSPDKGGAPWDWEGGGGGGGRMGGGGSSGGGVVSDQTRGRVRGGSGSVDGGEEYYGVDSSKTTSLLQIRRPEGGWRKRWSGEEGFVFCPQLSGGGRGEERVR